LTIQATRRFRNGLSFNVNYTYSKSLTDSALNGYAPGIQQNQYDRRLERAPDPSVRPQRLVFDYMYNLPFGHGQRFFPNMNPVANTVLGGWEVVGITTILSGQYLSPAFSGVDPANTNQFSGRPDCVGNGNIGDVRSRIKSGLPMWDQTAFLLPADGRGSYGNCARSVLYGPGRNLWNAGLTKNIMLHEGVRMQIQWELFNAWNHANFGNGTTDITSGNFGRTYSGGGGRSMLFGARIDF
ncbi:MAG TPA: hypothetical protein VFJ52_13570, partial [Terriglobia bacterium]|nr:hypothetical protein [Terriglobia bacterium]